VEGGEPAGVSPAEASLLFRDYDRLYSYSLDERRDDEPLIAEDVRAVIGVLSVRDFGEPAAACPGDLHGEVLGDDDVAIAEVRHRASAV